MNSHKIITKGICLFIGFLFLSCSKSPKKIADWVEPISYISCEEENFHEFHKIGDIVVDKKIVLLGESKHGDGKTHEIKSCLINYLVEEKGFNTLAIEGMGFLDLQLINSPAMNGFLSSRYRKDWDWMNLWVQSIQQEKLLEVKQRNRLDFIGIESISFILLNTEFWEKFIKIYLSDSKSKERNDEILKRMQQIYRAMYNREIEAVSFEDIQFFQEQLGTIKSNIKVRPSRNKPKELTNEILVMAIENMITQSELFKKMYLIGTDEAIKEWVNIRDKQMAENFIWYKKRHENAKIIVWAANFHGAKKIRAIRYKKEKPIYYDDCVLFGEYLYNAFGNEVYSIAFTSSRGESARVLEENAKKINAPEGTLEQQLENKGIEYGFIDFSAIRQAHPELKNKKFESTMLGHDPKPGKWLNVFDGVFFIQKNERAVKRNLGSVKECKL